MKAIHLIKYGEPQDVLKLVEIPEPGAPGADEILVRVNYSPINNSDLLMARGHYAMLPPSLPAIIGGEGVGTVEEIGTDVKHIKPGDKVSLPTGPIAWAELVKAPAKDFLVLPEAIDIKQAAMLTINPITAVLLLTEFVKLEKDDWIILNGANSGVGRSIIAVAKGRGLKIVAIVRRQTLVSEILAAGADLVLVESPEIPDQIKATLGKINIKIGLDVIGGEATNTLAKVVRSYGDIVVFGQMSGQGISVSVVDLVFRGINIHGFWLYYPQYLAKHKEAKTEAAGLILAGKINIPIANIYNPIAINDAVNHTLRGGKVLLEFAKS